MSKTWENLKDDPSLIVDICDHIANGGSPIQLAHIYNIKFATLIRWVRDDIDRTKLYNQAMFDRGEWVKERVLMELGHIATSDIAGMFDDSGSIKHPKDWPQELRRAVAGVDVKEEFDTEGALVGYVKKIKLWDKMKGLELTGKTLAMFLEKHEHTIEKSLEDLIVESYKLAEQNNKQTKDVNSNQSGPTTNTERGIQLQSTPEIPKE